MAFYDQAFGWQFTSGGVNGDGVGEQSAVRASMVRAGARSIEADNTVTFIPGMGVYVRVTDAEGNVIGLFLEDED